MSRLPVPGSDIGTWGQVLNDFLSVSHDTDGTIKTNAVSVASIQDNSVAGSKIQTSSVSASKLNITGGADGQVLEKDSTQAGGFKWGSLSVTVSLTSFYKSGVLSVTSGTQRLPIDGTYTIVGTRLTVGTAPVGANIIVDVKKNGSTIYTTQANRPTIIAGQNAGGPGVTPDITALSAGDFISIDIAQVGSSTAGSDLTVAVIVTKQL